MPQYFDVNLHALMQGTWVWLADHDLDYGDESQITVYAGRGILSESKGPVWMVGTACKYSVHSFGRLNANLAGLSLQVQFTEVLMRIWNYTAEHHVIYQYSLVGAQDHYMGLIQTESVSGSRIQSINAGSISFLVLCGFTTSASHSPVYQPVAVHTRV
jgi:hypothetical protein